MHFFSEAQHKTNSKKQASPKKYIFNDYNISRFDTLKKVDYTHNSRITTFVLPQQS